MTHYLRTIFVYYLMVIQRSLDEKTYRKLNFIVFKTLYKMNIDFLDALEYHLNFAKFLRH